MSNLKNNNNTNEVQIVAEIGINNSGSMKITKQLIDVASMAGCTHVKFQKRNPEVCVPEHQKSKMKDTPNWGKITYLEYKYKMEFGEKEYSEIAEYCKSKNIKWFASVWDIDSAKFMKKTMKKNIVKVPSALITNRELLMYCNDNFDHVQISTGMSTEEEIGNAIILSYPKVVYHTNSVYPTPIEDLNLGYITHLIKKYDDCFQVGFSNHFFGITPIISSVLLGVRWVEFHITMDRSMWGSDQMASVEPIGVFKLVKGIRDLEKAYKGNCERTLYTGEEIKMKSLRG